MVNNSSVRRNVVQVSDIPVGPAVHTIGVVDNKACVLTQQNIRRVADIRMITFCRLMPNGQLSPVNAVPTGAVNVFGGPVTNFLDLFAQAPSKKVKISNPFVKNEVLRVSEAPVAPAVHIPIMVGSEQYVVIQQDIRREIDIRMLTYSRLQPNNQLSPVTAQSTVPTAPVLNVFGDPVSNLQPLFVQTPQVPQVTIVPANWQIQVPENPAITKASLGTSTDDLRKNNGCQPCPSWQKFHSSCQTQTSPLTLDPNSQKNAGCQTQPDTTSTGCNTSSSLQLVGKENKEENANQCTDPEPILQQGQVRWNLNCPQEEPCTSRQIDIEDRRRYDCIRAKICAQRLAELQRQRQQDWDNTPHPDPPREWLQQGPTRRNSDYKALQQERREREQR